MTGLSDFEARPLAFEFVTFAADRASLIKRHAVAARRG